MCLQASLVEVLTISLSHYVLNTSYTMSAKTALIIHLLCWILEYPHQTTIESMSTKFLYQLAGQGRFFVPIYTSHLSSALTHRYLEVLELLELILPVVQNHASFVGYCCKYYELFKKYGDTMRMSTMQTIAKNFILFAILFKF